MKKLLTNKWFWVIAIVVVVGVFVWNGRKNGETVYEEIKVETRDLESVLVASGEVKSQRQATLNFTVGAKLAYVKVKEGDKVRKGQYLMGLEAGILDQAVDTAYNNYLAADANAKEVEDSVKGHEKDETFAQKNDRVAAQSARDKAYTIWQQAIRDRRNADLVAPFDGVVTNLTTNVVGDTVSIGDGLTVVDPENLWFEFELDESDVNKIKIGDKVSVELDALDERAIGATVESISYVPSVASTGATVYLARAILEEVDALRVGMGGDANFVLETRRQVLAVPFDVVVDQKVTVKVGSAVAEREVKTGMETDEYIEILEGVSADEIILRKK